jgi:hypothetical protein
VAEWPIVCFCCIVGLTHDALHDYVKELLSFAFHAFTRSTTSDYPSRRLIQKPPTPHNAIHFHFRSFLHRFLFGKPSRRAPSCLGHRNPHGRDDNNGTRNGTLAGDLKPVPRTFNQTKTLELLLLPAGFNFSNPDLNLTREEFGGMTTFRDSQLNQISGYHMSSASSSSIIHCETSSNSPRSLYLPNIIGSLRSQDPARSVVLSDRNRLLHPDVVYWRSCVRYMCTTVPGRGLQEGVHSLR